MAHLGLYPQLAKLQELRGPVLSTPEYPHSWHHLQVQGVPRTTPWFDNLLTGRPRTSLKAVMLTVTIYYRGRIQVKISQRKRCIDQSLEGFHLQSFPCPWDSLLPWHWCVIVHTEYCQPGKLARLRFCFEASVCRHAWLIDYPYGWTLLQVHSPKSITLNKMVGLCDMARPTLRSTVASFHPKQRHFYQIWHRLPPRSWAKRPDPSGQGQSIYYTV